MKNYLLPLMFLYNVCNGMIPIPPMPDSIVPPAVQKDKIWTGTNMSDLYGKISVSRIFMPVSLKITNVDNYYYDELKPDMLTSYPDRSKIPIEKRISAKAKALWQGILQHEKFKKELKNFKGDLYVIVFEGRGSDFGVTEDLNTKELKGQNYIGQILMNIRDYLQNNPIKEEVSPRDLQFLNIQHTKSYNDYPNKSGSGNAISWNDVADTIQFYYGHGDHFTLSNDYPAPIFINDDLWLSAHHYIQAHKFSDPSWQEFIRYQDTATKVDSYVWGKFNSISPEDDWPLFMKAALWKKFTQHKDLKTALLSTGDKVIVYNTQISPRTFKDPVFGNGADGKGNNYLGRLLMVVRALLKRQSLDSQMRDLNSEKTKKAIEQENRIEQLFYDAQKAEKERELKEQKKKEELNMAYYIKFRNWLSHKKIQTMKSWDQLAQSIKSRFKKLPAYFLNKNPH